MTPPKEVTDAGRLAALEAYDILDTPPEPGFDEVVHIARVLCDTPVALVSFVAGNRQWFKARAGFEPCETDLDRSVCAFVLTSPDLLIIPDLSQDPRTRGNPLVTGEPHIRFYAGAPLKTSKGEILGSLCVIDGVARPEGLNSKQESGLRNLAAQVMVQMDLRRALSQRDKLIAAQAESDRRRHALLDLGDSLRDATTVEDLIQVASGIVGKALGATRAGFGYLDASGEHVDIVSDWTMPGVVSIAGRHRIQDYGDLEPGNEAGDPVVVNDVRTDPRTASSPGPLLDLGIEAHANVPVRVRGHQTGLLFVHCPEPRTWPPEVIAFLRNFADRIEAGVARIRAQADQRVLNHELSHRMKNMMSMVQAIAVQTLKAVSDKPAVASLMDRLSALSSAHDVLLQENWSSAPIRSVAKSALEVFRLGDRFSITGDEVILGPRAALSLAMLLHELTTNAVKYGALSVEGGRVSVSWRLEGSNGHSELVLDWHETGGPKVHEPKGHGFGTRLIKMGLVGTGGVVLRYLASGFEAEFRAPLDQVQRS